jgi:hypothetical protein
VEGMTFSSMAIADLLYFLSNDECIKRKATIHDGRLASMGRP